MGKRNFENAFSAKDKKKADEKIKSVAEEIHKENKKQELKKFTLRLPMNLYTLLLSVSEERGIPMKSIVVDALWDKLKEK